MQWGSSGGERASERLRCDGRSGLEDWDIAARLEKREKGCGRERRLSGLLWLRCHPRALWAKREKKFDFC